MEAGIELSEIGRADPGDVSYLRRAQALVASRADLFAVDVMTIWRGSGGRIARRGPEPTARATSRQLTLPLRRGRTRRRPSSLRR